VTELSKAPHAAQAPQPCDLLIAGGLLMTLDSAQRIFADGAVAITGSLIIDVGDRSALECRWQPARRIDARHRMVMPGLVNVHNHSPLMITRGMVEDLGYAPMYTPWVPQGHRLSADEAYLLALLGVYELLRTGSTTIVDYYLYPEALARAHATLGTRAVIGGRIHDADPEALSAGRHEYRRAIGEASLAENAALIDAWNGYDSGRIRCDWAPHAADTCSDDLLREVARLVASHPGNVHTHLAQSPAEVARVRERTGCTPAQLFESLGLLDRRMIAAHCIHLDAQDVERCGRAGITVAHSPIGNAKSGTIAPVLELEKAGATIALCTDTMAGDMVEAMRWAVSMQRIRANGDLVLDAAHALRWATATGAAALGMGESIGAIEVGRKADLLLLDTDSPSLAPIVDGAGVLVWSGSGKDVDTVLVDGRVVLDRGRLLTADGPELVLEAQRCAERLWTRAGRPPITCG
jgi:5-methylthioadenosine/S-adenosylhomocysteine deaminase